MAGDVVADCLRLVARLYVIILIADALMVRVLGAMTPEEWLPHDRGAKLAALSAVAIYAFWRFVKFRMDSYIASNPLPSADAAGDAEDEAKVAASRLRTLMPLLRAVAGSVIVVVGGLLVLSELGVNITPLIAGASVFGLAVSFGSQSLVRDIVSGMFFLAEDSFRIGEYVDCSKVKGTVEGFSVRSLKLRHQNGQLHIVPFGQVGHITNFSRDWTVVKFNLAFAHGTDVELLRKTVKKMGTDMMEEPTFKPILLQPLKMQGVVDIKDNSLIVRFKFMARPKNPSMIQRMAIRRMYESFPALGIQFATPNYPFAIAAPPVAPSPPAADAARPLRSRRPRRRRPPNNTDREHRRSNTMEKRKLGHSGLEFAPIAFGGNVFGWTADEATSHKLLDAFVDAGFSFVDTADVYSRWVPGHKGGESEVVIGSWLKKDPKKRDKVLIATKCGMEMPNEGQGLSRAHIKKSVDASLKRLNTDRIDLFQSHHDDKDTPLEETLSTYGELIKAGKLRSIGASNFEAPRLAEAAKIAKDKGLPRYESLQPHYNLMERALFEGALEDECLKEGIGVIPY